MTNDTKKNILNKQTLTLVRGLPGAGKSTLARQLSNVDSSIHIEADMYFMNGNVYTYNQAMIGNAHYWCQDRTTNALLQGRSVVVSNTFTTLKEMRPYFEIALEYGIIPTIFLAQNDFGNVHDVPEESLQKMRNRFCFDVSPLIKEFKNRFDFESSVQ